ncbi:hypothetical protein M0804_006541 [Polistes exclamans]|nr:hypothetical protein M0804_006541 [Polistes exclamans]
MLRVNTRSGYGEEKAMAEHHISEPKVEAINDKPQLSGRQFRRGGVVLRLCFKQSLEKGCEGRFQATNC